MARIYKFSAPGVVSICFLGSPRVRYASNAGTTPVSALGLAALPSGAASDCTLPFCLALGAMNPYYLPSLICSLAENGAHDNIDSPDVKGVVLLGPNGPLIEQVEAPPWWHQFVVPVTLFFALIGLMRTLIDCMKLSLWLYRACGKSLSSSHSSAPTEIEGVNAAEPVPPPPAPIVVFGTSTGKKFHRASNCGGLDKARKIIHMTSCPSCQVSLPGPEVFRVRGQDEIWHSNENCDKVGTLVGCKLQACSVCAS